MAETLLDLPAVRKHGTGVDSRELAEFHQAMFDHGKERFLGIGSKQYEPVRGGPQKFETLDQRLLVAELLEELVDVQNYVTMLAIKVIAAYRKDTN